MLADWSIVDALLDEPTTPLNEVVKRTGLSPKTIRRHLQRMLDDEAIFIMPMLGSLADSGELVYHLAVTGTAGMSELRRALGDAFMVGGADKPPLKYLLCRADDLADVMLPFVRLMLRLSLTVPMLGYNRKAMDVREPLQSGEQRANYVESHESWHSHALSGLTCPGQILKQHGRY